MTEPTTPAPSARSTQQHAAAAPGGRRRDDPQLVVDLLGALSYAQLSGFEELAADAQMTPQLRPKLDFARLAVAMFARCEAVGARLAELGMPPDEAMAPFAAAIDAFHERTAPSDWLEGIVKVYVGDGILRDYHLEMAGRLVGPDRDFIVELLSPVGEPVAVLSAVHDAVGADGRVHGRLSLWARRIMGETLQCIQSVAVERDSLTGLLVGGEPGADLNETGRMFTRLTEAHTKRMQQLGLTP